MKTGFIGCGNMATAMIKGILKSGFAVREDICASARSDRTREKIEKELGISYASNEETAGNADLLILAVKPQFYEEVIAQIKDCVRPGTVVVSIAPGKTIDWLRAQFGRDLKLIRLMPNTPALAGEGMTGLCASKWADKEDIELVKRFCASFGECEEVPENLMDVVTSVSGSSPAYIYILIEAMADAAVADGMRRDQAYRFAAQAVLGSARMVLETGIHPGQLKDQVCSPGGTTIEAVRVLEEKGFRSAVIEAMKACTRKSRGM